MRLIIFTSLMAALLSLGAAHAQTTPGPLFVTSDQCIACHNGLIAPSGVDISPATDWRPTMMANSARDPYWHAGVRRETLDHPNHAAAIEAECARCHMPMDSAQAIAGGGQGTVLAHLPLAAAATPGALMAADGVSCSACHQLTAEALGEPQTFSGNYHIDTTLPLGQRPAYGPFAVDAGRSRLMSSASQLVPQQGEHVRQAEFCAACHTLITHSLGPDGDVIAEFPEQVPYLEWQHSLYAEQQSCQDCHMPLVEAAVPIASVAGQPREGVRQHRFRGGNTVIPRLFAKHAVELAVTASSLELERALRDATDHLQQAAASVAVEKVAVEGERLVAQVRVENRAGHKLPTAYPSRRVWLHVTIADAAGQVLLESGALQPSGAIVGNDNDADAAQYEPHYQVIESAEQVQIYEPIMADPEGRVTTGLLTAVAYAKDNRLLPQGFAKAGAPDWVAVRGAAVDDDDFEAPGDRVRYAVALGEAALPVTVTAELWYQPIGYRWAHNLAEYDAAETQRFVAMYQGLQGVTAVKLARASGRLDALPVAAAESEGVDRPTE